MGPEEFKQRSRKLALGVCRVVDGFERQVSADVIGRQLVRAATSVAANYRAACRARSHREFVAKLGIVEEEADETLYWLELAVDRGLADCEAITGLRREADELLAITVASIRTARRGRERRVQSAIHNPQSAIVRSAAGDRHRVH